MADLVTAAKAFSELFDSKWTFAFLVTTPNANNAEEESKDAEERFVTIPNVAIVAVECKATDALKITFEIPEMSLIAAIVEMPRFISVPAKTVVGLHNIVVVPLYLIFAILLLLLDDKHDTDPLTFKLAFAVNDPMLEECTTAFLFTEANALNVEAAYRSPMARFVTFPVEVKLAIASKSDTPRLTTAPVDVKTLVEFNCDCPYRVSIILGNNEAIELISHTPRLTSVPA